MQELNFCLGNEFQFEREFQYLALRVVFVDMFVNYVARLPTSYLLKV